MLGNEASSAARRWEGSPPTAEKPLNKHQLRSRKSRKKVIDAAIDLINEEGATNATTRRIAERAGVTWGVLQRQFGSKKAIFAAVMDTWVPDFLAALDAIDVDHENLEAMVEEFVSVFWSLFSRPLHRAGLEIVLNSAESFESNTQRIANEMYGCWKEHIQRTDSTLDKETAGRAGELMITALSGYAIRRAFRPEEDPALEPQRAFLVKALMAALRES